MAIGSNEQYAAGPFQANDLIVNNQAMFSNPGMMALVAKEARKGTGGFFEIPNRERKEAPFLTAAKERVNQDLGLSPAVQGGMKNFLGESETVEDAPKKWQSSPDSPATELAYITNKEKDLLLKANLHDSLGDGMPNQGPSGIISLDGGGSYADETAQRESSYRASGNTGRRESYQEPEKDYDNQQRDQSGTRIDPGPIASIAADEEYYGDDAFDTSPVTNVRSSGDTSEGQLLSQIEEAERLKNEKLYAEKTGPGKFDYADEEFKYANADGSYDNLVDRLKIITGKDDSTKDKDSGLTKDLLKKAKKLGLDISGISTFGALMKLLSNPRPEQLRDPNYLAIMNDIFKKNPNRLKEYMAEHADIIAEGMGKLPPSERTKGFEEYVSGFMPQEGTEAERRIDPESYYANALRGNTTGELEQLGNTVITDGMSTEFKNKIFAAREASRVKGDNNNKYQGYSGPVVEKDLVVPDPVTAVETPVIDPAVGTRDFATPAAGGSQYQLPMDYRAALTRDGEYGINTDPKSIAYSGGFNQMEDMDEYLKRIGKKRKNYLDADGNPIMTNAMGGL